MDRGMEEEEEMGSDEDSGRQQDGEWEEVKDMKKQSQSQHSKWE